jgi:hypothetical protein
MGKVEYSPVVTATCLCRWLWQKSVHWKQGRRVSCNLLRRTAKKCGITDALHISLAEAQQCYKACDKDSGDMNSFAATLPTKLAMSHLSHKRRPNANYTMNASAMRLDIFVRFLVAPRVAPFPASKWFRVM